MRAGALALLAVAACAGAVPPAGSPSHAAGERAYQKCYACHSLGGPDPATQGPSLKGIVGRPVAGEEGFAYSRAMRAYRSVRPRWTRETLDAFIADPQGVVPDNEMGFFGIANDQERRALVEFLARS